MSRKRELQKQLGSGYIYERYLDERSLRQLKRQPPEDFSEMVIAALTVGCLRLNAVLYRSDETLIQGYDVLRILETLRKYFPNLTRVSSYAAPGDILRKSLDERKQLKEAGLTMLYYGMESGDSKTLKDIRKGVQCYHSQSH